MRTIRAELPLTETMVLRPRHPLAPTVGAENAVGCLALSRNGELVAVGRRGGSIDVWDAMMGARVCTLDGHKAAVQYLTWSSDGRLLASRTADAKVKVWSVGSCDVVREYALKFHGRRPIAWSPVGSSLAIVQTDGTVALHDPVSGTLLASQPQGRDAVLTLAWSEGGAVLASGNACGDICLWQPSGRHLLRVWPAHRGAVRALAWLQNDSLLASVGDDLTVTIWDPNKGLRVRELEGHMGTVSALSSTRAARLLASAANDGTVRLWRTDTWEGVAEIPAMVPAGVRPIVELHATQSIVACPGPEEGAVTIWRYLASEVAVAASAGSVQYCNAKVVLLGDTGCGKTGLATVLVGRPYQLTESTHSRHVWTLHSATVHSGRGVELREVLLWDLAGQPHYRLVHQLHLGDAAVVLLVFTARSDMDQFAGARYWAEALRRAEARAGAGARRVHTILVAARADVGRPERGSDDLRSVLQTLGAQRFIETSARTGMGVAELREAILSTIDWTELPRVSSTDTFTKIRSFIEAESRKMTLARTVELFQRFVGAGGSKGWSHHLGSALQRAQASVLRSFGIESGGAEPPRHVLERQFRACIGLLEAKGLVRQFGFGDLVLLQPAYLDSYASAIVEACKDSSDQLRSVARAAVLDRDFLMDDDSRVADAHQEELLVYGTLRDLIDREIAYAFDTDDGERLVFPAFTPGDGQAAVMDPDSYASMSFAGPLRAIYVTLSVRLAHTGRYSLREVSAGKVRYGLTDQVVGFDLHLISEGAARLVLVASDGVPAYERRLFEQFILRHVRRSADSDSVEMRQLVRCQPCGLVLDETIAQRALARGLREVGCPLCSRRIVVEWDRSPDGVLDQELLALEWAADSNRQKRSERTRMDGKRVAFDFDVFISYDHDDRPQALALANWLKEAGVLPWIDAWITPGEKWIQAIQRQMDRVPTAIVLVGPSGIKRWQEDEVEVLLARRTERRDVRLIPVILPGASHSMLPALLRTTQVIDLNPLDAADSDRWAAGRVPPPIASTSIFNLQVLAAAIRGEQAEVRPPDQGGPPPS